MGQGDGETGSNPEEAQPVLFPTATAQHAVAICGEVADLLLADLEARVDIVEEAQDGWAGRHREEFDEEWEAQEAALGALKDALRGLAGAFEDALDDVQSLNASRGVDRQDIDPYRPAQEGEWTFG